MATKIFFKTSDESWDGCWCERVAKDGDASVYVRGYAFHEDRVYENDGLAAFFLERFGACDKDNMAETAAGVLGQLNGYFAVVFIGKHCCVAAVDRVRSCPLFYRMEKGRLTLSSHPGLLLDENETLRMNADASLEFLLTGYVTGADTLFADIAQINQGHLLVAGFETEPDKMGLVVYSYFRFFNEDVEDWGDNEAEERLYGVMEGVFKRYARLFKSKKILLPLSGGLDSRLVIAMLKKAGVADIICYSYGDSKSPDARISQRLAASMGLKWHFIEYKGWPYWQALKTDPKFSRYLLYGSAASSIAHPQDWPAVRQLLKQYGAEEPVFVPGHTGDFVSGGHLPPDLILRKDKEGFDNLAAEAIFGHHYDLWSLPSDDAVLKTRMLTRIKRFFPLMPLNREMAAKGYEHWEWGGRQARFIINSIRVYDFFRCQWAMPLWDADLMAFFMKMSINAKYKKRVYINTLIRKVFTGGLAALGQIDVDSTTKLVYRKKEDPLPEVPKTKKAIGAILGIPLVNWVPVILRSYRHDPFKIYGFFMKKTNGTAIFEKTKSTLPELRFEHLPDVNRVVSSQLQKPLFMQSLRGLFAARYLARLSSTGP